MNSEFVHHITAMLQLGKKIISNNKVLDKETGSINVKGDRTIEMDVKIEKAFIDYIKKQNLPADIFSEEIGRLNFHKDPKFLVVFDPLDGSTNYKIGQNFLPFGSMVAIFDGLRPHLKGVISAGAIEYTKNLAWIYDGEKTTDLGGKIVRLKTDWHIHRSTPVYLDLYYKQGYEDYLLLAEKVFVRNTGSTIGNLSYVLSNVASALGHVCMRPEEVGTVYALIKGAHGIAVDHNRQDVGAESFSSDHTYQILAGSKNIVEFMVSNLKAKS